MAFFYVKKALSMDLILDSDYARYSFEVIQRSRTGVQRGKADEIAAKIGITDKELAPILNLSERTLHRLRPDALPYNNSSERLLLLEQLFSHGLDVFDERADVFGRWLRIPLSELHQNTPLEILDTATGFGMVHNVLGRIKHGIYA